MKRLLLAVAFVSGLCAHDLYIMPSVFRLAGQSALTVAFHNGDSFPESEVAPKPERLRNAQLLGKSGRVAVGGLHIAGKETLGQVSAPLQGDYILAVETVPNFIELPPDKFNEYLKEEGLMDVVEWRNLHNENGKPGRERYTKFAKALVLSGAPDGFGNHPMEFPIEIVPLADPYTLHAGSRCPVRVNFHGKPAPGLQVELAWSSGAAHQTTVAGRTGADGILDLVLAKAGKYRLHSLKMERCADPKIADWESSWASLTFELQR